MTRNLYLGADLTPGIRASNPADLLAATAHIFTVVRQTDFPARAKALAREVVAADPILLGLQEAAVWSSGPLADPAPATTVEYDFVASLRTELAALGAPYDVVRMQAEADIESPAGEPYLKDVRLVQQDAILVRARPGAERPGLAGARSANFTATLVLPTGTGRQFPVLRGWEAVDVTVGRRPFRFVNTHLEAFDAGIRQRQAQELVAPDGPIGSAPGPVVLVGDLNTGADLPVPANRLAFQVLVDHGLVDAWASAHPGDPGLTSGFGELLADPADTLEFRVDHVMALGAVKVTAAHLTGTTARDRTPGGLWPSDHAGLAVTVAL